MPFGPYEDFGSCVAAQKRKGHGDEAARKICGALRRDLESQRERGKTLQSLLIVEAAAAASLHDAARQAEVEPAAFVAALAARSRARALSRSRLLVENPAVGRALALTGQDRSIDIEGARATAEFVAEAASAPGTDGERALRAWRAAKAAACWDTFKAFNLEQRAGVEAFKRAGRTGRFVPKVSKVWVATLDDRTCEWCHAMDGEEVGEDDEFDVAEVAGDNPFDGDEPPLHRWCRCVLAIEGGDDDE